MVGAWVRLVAYSAVVAAVVVAAQLGAGDALGLYRWTGPHDDQAWITLLTWVAFGYAGAVLAGALAGRGTFRRLRGRDSFGTRIAASLAAAGGAAAVIGLAWLPARELRPPVNVNPGLVVSITAGAGVMVGLVLALITLSTRPMAANVLATVAWVWVVGIGAAIAGLTAAEPFAAPRVGVPDAPSLIPSSVWTGPRIMIITSIVLGMVVAGVARWRGASRLATAFSGFAGPALVAAAYLIAGPGEDQNEAYVSALLAVAAGLAASAVVAIPGRAAAAEGEPARDDGPAEPQEASGDVLISTRAPVPAGPSSSSSSRPAWAEGSGPIARAYSSAATQAADPASATTTRGTGWDADTLAGTTHATGARSADRPERGGGLYRSTGGAGSPEPTKAQRPAVGAVMGQPTDPHESWVDDLRSTGRHAAAD